MLTVNLGSHRFVEFRRLARKLQKQHREKSRLCIPESNNDKIQGGPAALYMSLAGGREAWLEALGDYGSMLSSRPSQGCLAAKIRMWDSSIRRQLGNHVVLDMSNSLIVACEVQGTGLW